MSVARLAVAFMVVGMILAGGVTALEQSFSEAGNQQTVTNETFTPDGGNITTLSESNRDDVIYNRSVTIYDDSGTDTTVASEPEDYRWFESNGTLKTNETGSLAGDSSANITYGYFDSTEQKIGAQQLTSFLPRLFGLMLPLGLVIAFIAFLS